ncbi:uncharacterized protein IL334_001202 [Kwoniella shivajii]|uniref:Tethering factor for nuclear proteasome STS1 n=1 Tax=Kwoniella shivajii TaxID=564305 RepID=A0ABZ1CR99_9TREE|nr:hypothetical protein IL334_001202 [Kwoniella shivajii]
MAHPLAQQPPSSLPFAFAARTSPLAFGFGIPSSSTSASLRSSSVNWSPPGQSPIKSPISRSDLASRTPLSSLKRSRRSRSPSSSPPLSPSSPASSSSHLRGSTYKVDLSAAGLDLQDISEVHKPAKRTRLGSSEAAQPSTNDIDIGIILATLPASAHLPILLQLLRTHPSLSETVLSQIPQPEVRTCINEIDASFDAIHKAAGGSLGLRGGSAVSESRRWERVRSEVEVFCRTASTYIRYFTSSSKSPIDTQSIFTFLEPLTTHLQTVLRLVPSAAASSNPVLDLAKLVLSVWTLWLSNLLTEVNQQGGMYPHSTVSHWAETLDRLTASVIGTVTAHDSHWSSSTTNPSSIVNAFFEESFRQALIPVRHRFLNEVGWLIGRR